MPTAPGGIPDELFASSAQSTTGSSPTTFRFGDYIFSPDSGELFSSDGKSEVGGALLQRLAPQPSHLLALLIQKRGGVLSREEIREKLWPDVSVDFDQGLHFCIRQIRTALSDSAKNPSYIETLPRRGYRLLALVEPITPEKDSSQTAEEAAIDPQQMQEDAVRVKGHPPSNTLLTKAWHRSRLAVGMVMLLVTLGLSLAALRTSRSRPIPTESMAQQAGAMSPTRAASTAGEVAPIRLAIMSFRAPETTNLQTSKIADLLLIHFGDVDINDLELIGPSTTAAYGTNLLAVADFARDHPVDFLINGRFLFDDEEKPRMLVEIIRASDGAHLYVKAFEEFSSVDGIAREITRGVEETIGIHPDSKLGS